MKSKRPEGLFSQNTRKKDIPIIVICVICAICESCTGTKYLNEGDTFYEGAKIKFIPQGNVRRLSGVETDLQQLITPKPNKKFLGSRFGVWAYYHKGFIKKKFGREPVLLKNATPQRTAEMLEAELQNEGYFRSTVQSEVSTNDLK